MTIEDWQNEPGKSKRRLLAELSEKLAIAEHPCADCTTDEECPCGDICAYKRHYDELTRVKALRAQQLAAEKIAEINEGSACGDSFD